MRETTALLRHKSFQEMQFNFNSDSPLQHDADTLLSKTFLFLRGQYGFASVVTLRVIVLLICVSCFFAQTMHGFIRMISVLVSDKHSRLRD
jgi:hypothetical protein